MAPLTSFRFSRKSKKREGEKCVCVRLSFHPRLIPRIAAIPPRALLLAFNRKPKPIKRIENPTNSRIQVFIHPRKYGIGMPFA